MIPQGFKPPWFNYVEYSESSPSGLVWVKEVGRGGSLKHSGSFAGSISKFGRNLKYWRIGLHNTTYFNHRVIWEIFNGPILDGLVINHIDNNSLNNNILNLELVSSKENQHKSYQHNGLGLSAINKSGVLGVSDYCSIIAGVEYKYAHAQFREVSGKKVQKYFRYYDVESREEAFKLAREWRKLSLMNLIQNGVAFYKVESL